MAEASTQLPPGWDFKYDTRSNRYYFINHYTKMTTWEDPRLRHRLLQATPTQASNQESIPMQHGSPETRRNYVYPSQTCPQPAFQIPAHYSPKSIPIQEFSNTNATANRMASPSFNRVAQLSQVTSRLQETTLSSSSSDVEQSVSKISTMFPTVSQTHIKLLLKKYYNREAVVISALQVEKHPITTPGPYTTPPPARNFNSSVHVPMQMTPPPGVRPYSRTGSPIARPGSGGSSAGSPYIGDSFRNSPKPHSSPKMKLRYMKSLYPKVDEDILLEVMANHDNNVQKTSEALQSMGYEKKEKITVKITKPEVPKLVEEINPKDMPPPRIKTLDEKNKMKSTLQLKYKEIPEQVITLALESVDYDEERAGHILKLMVQEEKDAKTITETVPENEEDIIEESPSSVTLKIVKSKSSLMTPSPSIRTLLSDKMESSKVLRVREKKNSFRPVSEQLDKDDNDYKSSYLTKTTGPNPTLAKGSDNKMLLEDYITWDGPDPNLRHGMNGGLAKGPNSSLLSKRTYQACGPNSELHKGPSFGLAKGSIFIELKTVILGESRCK